MISSLKFRGTEVFYEMFLVTSYNHWNKFTSFAVVVAAYTLAKLFNEMLHRGFFIPSKKISNFAVVAAYTLFNLVKTSSNQGLICFSVHQNGVIQKQEAAMDKLNPFQVQAILMRK